MNLAIIVPLILVVLIVIWFTFFQRKWKAGGKVPRDLLNRSLQGMTAIVTGANVGIGLETAKQLAKQGCTVIVGVRDSKKGNETVEVINKYVGAKRAEYVTSLELSDLQNVRNFAEKVKDRRIDFLVNNAGIMMPEHTTTKDGFEIQFGTNHLGHFLLTTLLLENLKLNNARVITVSSIGHNFCRTVDIDNIKGPQKNYSKQYLYGRAKLANILFAKELNFRHGLVSYSLHPGNIKTNLARHLPGYSLLSVSDLSTLFMKTPWEGAQTNLYACLCDEKKVPPGSYLFDCKAVKSWNPNSYDVKLRKKLWEISEQAVAPFKTSK